MKKIILMLGVSIVGMPNFFELKRPLINTWYHK
jgi:hypothetical protein